AAIRADVPSSALLVRRAVCPRQGTPPIRECRDGPNHHPAHERGSARISGFHAGFGRPIHNEEKMSYTALTLIVLAALVHATWNLLAKRAAHAGPIFVFAYTVISAVGYLPWVAWLIIEGAMSWTWPVVACIALSGGLHLAYSLF